MTMNNKTWKRLLGYSPTKEMKADILTTVQEEKISIEEVCGRMALPPICIDGHDLPPESERYCNPYRPAVLITTRKRREERDKLNK